MYNYPFYFVFNHNWIQNINACGFEYYQFINTEISVSISIRSYIEIKQKDRLLAF